MMLLLALPQAAALSSPQHVAARGRTASLCTSRRALILTPAAAALGVATARAEEEPYAYQDVIAALRACKDDGVCRIVKVKFTTANGESADAIFDDGSQRPIVGIPADDPTSDSSPYRLVAKCRDAKVAYSFPFSEGLEKYRSKK